MQQRGTSFSSEPVACEVQRSLVNSVRESRGFDRHSTGAFPPPQMSLCTYSARQPIPPLPKVAALFFVCAPLRRRRRGHAPLWFRRVAPSPLERAESKVPLFESGSRVRVLASQGSPPWIYSRSR